MIDFQNGNGGEDECPSKIFPIMRHPLDDHQEMIDINRKMSEKEKEDSKDIKISTLCNIIIKINLTNFEVE